MIIPISSFLKWPIIVPLIQTAMLLGGFILLGRMCSSFEYKIKTENDEENYPKDIFNRKEFCFMIVVSIIADMVVYQELKQYLINDGGFSYQLLIGTIAAAIGAMISIEDLFYGKSLIDAVKEAIGLNIKGLLSKSVAFGSFLAGFVLIILGYYSPRHVESETKLSYTRKVLIVVLLFAATVCFAFSMIIKKKNSKKST